MQNTKSACRRQLDSQAHIAHRKVQNEERVKLPELSALFIGEGEKSSQFDKIMAVSILGISPDIYYEYHPCTSE